MNSPQMEPNLRQLIFDQARAGISPEIVVRQLVERGWAEQPAIDAIESVMREFLLEHAQAHALPPPVRVPSPIVSNGSSILKTPDREVALLANLVHPRVVVLGGLLSNRECDELKLLGSERLARSGVVNNETGHDEIHEARTSEDAQFCRGANELIKRIEIRIAALLDWPLEYGEGLQLLRYGVGAEYKPHYDYFDPKHPGSHGNLARGGQRVASLVMYLNTPLRGGATTFPDAKLEVAAVKGNAVFFSYDRPHPMTHSLHGGAPVLEGEKWIATKWLRESRHN
jgi:prolyl 4-hydroxylase